METSVEQLEDNKVKLVVAVPSETVEKAIDLAFVKISKEVRIDGFRPGKVPRRILEARIGVAAAREQAINDALPTYYADAIHAAKLDPIAPPEVDITAGAEAGDFTFEAIVEVRPVVELIGYDTIRVEIDPIEVVEDELDRQIDAMRDRFAELEDTPNPLTIDDYASIDVEGSVQSDSGNSSDPGGEGEAVSVPGLSATDFLYRVGSELVVPAIDAALLGKRPGDIVEVTDTLPERFGDAAGKTASFRVLVKEAKRKVLPELTDEWVTEVSELETLEALREDLRTRLASLKKSQARSAFRAGVMEMLSGLVTIELPDPLVQKEMESRIHDVMHRLENQGATLPEYLEATGTHMVSFLADLRVGAELGVRADLALRAVVLAEEIAATDAEVDLEISTMALQMGESVENITRKLGSRGGLDALRLEIARASALEFVLAHATLVDSDGNEIDLEDSQHQLTADQAEVIPQEDAQ